MHELVVNKRSGEPFDVYVGRPSEWGNPYSHRDGTQALYKVDTVDQAIEAYRGFLWKRIQNEGEPIIRRLASLAGKRLACWCAPGPCHADVLVIAALWAERELERTDPS